MLAECLQLETFAYGVHVRQGYTEGRMQTDHIHHLHHYW